MDIYPKTTVPATLRTLSPEEIVRQLQPHLHPHGLVLIEAGAGYPKRDPYKYHVPVEFLGGPLTDADAVDIQQVITDRNAGRKLNLTLTLNARREITSVSHGGGNPHSTVQQVFYTLFGPPSDGKEVG